MALLENQPAKSLYSLTKRNVAKYTFHYVKYDLPSEGIDCTESLQFHREYFSSHAYFSQEERMERHQLSRTSLLWL